MLYVFVNKKGDLALPCGKEEYPAFTNKADAEKWLQWVKHWSPTEEDGLAGWFGAVENTKIRIQILTKELLLKELEDIGVEVFEELIITDEEYEELLHNDEFPILPMLALNPKLSYHKNIENWIDDCDQFFSDTDQSITGNMIRLLGYDHYDFDKALAKAVEAENTRYQRLRDEEILAGITDIRIYDPDPEGQLTWNPDEEDF